MPTDNTPRAAVAHVRLLRCMSCGNTVECRPADLHRFTQTDWLRCCGAVMALFTPADQPGVPPIRYRTEPTGPTAGPAE